MHITQKYLIGVHGLKGAGKDTVAAMLCKYLPLTKLAFADRLKATCAAAFGLSLDHFYSEILKEVVVPKWGISPRTMMLRTSDALQAQFGQRIFLDHTIPVDWAQQKTGLILTDVRRGEEAELIYSMGGIIIHVLRPSNTVYSEASNGHWTEQGLVQHKTDYVLNNTGDKVHLLHEVRALIFKVYGPTPLAPLPYVPNEWVEP